MNSAEGEGRDSEVARALLEGVLERRELVGDGEYAEWLELGVE